MNAVVDTPAEAPRAAGAGHVHPVHRFRWLLRREFWEHKGGFLWAPLVAGGISLLLSAMGMVLAMVAARGKVPPEPTYEGEFHERRFLDRNRLTLIESGGGFSKKLSIARLPQ